MAQTPPHAEEPPAESEGVLHSWKEIATHLRRDVRTVQRWEKSEGLPVRRHWHHRLGSVYAYKAELDAWWNNHHDALDPGVAASLDPAAIPGGAFGREHTAARARRNWGIAAAVLAMLAAGFLLSSRWTTRATHSAAIAPLAIIEATVPRGGLSLVVRAADVNGDGLDDAVVSNSAVGETGIFFGAGFRGAMRLTDRSSVLVRVTHGRALTLMGAADINGDGMKDLVWVEGLGDREGFAATGTMLVVFGRRHWSEKLSLPADAGLKLPFSISHQASPMETANTRTLDWNGDGLEDLIFSLADFSPPGRASAGAIVVLWGRRKWPAQMDPIEHADVTVWGAEKGEGLQSAAVGDINGDGKPDLVVSASDSPLWELRQRRGRVYAFFGRDRLPRILDARKDYDLRIDGAQPRDIFSQLALGDVNGDGIQDIVVGAARANETGTGHVHIYYGRRNWPRQLAISEADWTLADSEPVPGFGASVSVRDVTLDGWDDLLVCKTRPTFGEVRVFYGSSNPRQTFAEADLVLKNPEPGDGTCSGPPALADFDGNGTPEILVAAPTLAGASNPDARRAHVFAPLTAIQIDVRPGSYPNAVWPGSFRTVVVEVPIQKGFDPAAIDPSTVRFVGIPPAQVQPCQGASPVGLCFFFESKELRLKPGDRRAVLVGKTRDGTAFLGSDSVLVLTDATPKP